MNLPTGFPLRRSDLPRSFLSLALASVLLSASGCILVSSNGGSRGDVTFLWSFNSNTCALVPDVTHVTIAIPGQSLSSGGDYNCSTSGTAGITLLNFAPGTYNYTIEGRNNGGSILYQSSGRFTVDGNVTVNANLQPNGSATGSVYLTWTFPPSGTSGGQPATCGQTVGPISAVEVTIDNATTPYVATCADGQTSPGVRVDNLQAGTHTINISARGNDHGAPTGQTRDLYFYSKTSTVQVVAGTQASQQFTLDWAVGGVALKWTFNNGATQLNCAQAGVTTVYVNLRDSAGTFFPDTSGSGVAVPCVANGIQGSTLPSQYLSYLYSGNYQLYVQAYGTGNVLYKTNMSAPPTTSVTAGVFPQLDTTTQTVVMSL